MFLSWHDRGEACHSKVSSLSPLFPKMEGGGGRDRECQEGEGSQDEEMPSHLGDTRGSEALNKSLSLPPKEAKNV